MLSSSSEIKVRRSKLADTRGLADVFRASWQHAYSGIIPHLHLENVVRRRGPEWWRRSIRAGENLLTLEVNGTVAGYATLGAARTRGKASGEIYELYLSPTYQGLGFGEHLFEACRLHLDQRRLKGLLVWVLAENTPAIEFYWRRGGRPVAREFETFGTSKIEKIAFTWS